MAELSAVIGALLDALDDKNENVNYSIYEAIKKLSHHNPQVVIHAAIYYFELHRKISSSHAVTILKIMMETLREELTELSIDLAVSVAELAVEKLIGENMEKEASELLVALSRLHSNQAMGALLNKFQLGIIPECSVIRAMGLIASCNPFGMVPFIKLTLNVMHPMIYQVRDDEYKYAVCFIIGKFAEAINDYIMNLDEAPDPRINRETFIDEMSEAYETLVNVWLKSTKNNKLEESILIAICPVLSLLPEQYSSERTAKLIPLLLSLCKLSVVRLSATRVLGILLELMDPHDHARELIRPFIEQIQQTLFDFVCVTPFEAYRDALLTHYEVLQCLRALVIIYPEESLDRIIQQLKSINSQHRARALVIVRHLINTLPVEEDISLQRIALSIQNILTEHGGARNMVGAIVALAAHPTLQLLPSQRSTFIRFIVVKCGIINNETQAYEEALFLLATTVDGAEIWLWPLLIRALLDSSHTTSAAPILRALSALTAKIIRNDNSGSALKEFSGTKVLARCLELLGQKQNRLAVIIFLRSAAPLMGHQLKPEWDIRLLDISKLLKDDDYVWEEQMVEFLEKSVELEGSDWAAKLSNELMEMCNSPIIPGILYLAAVTDNPEHLKSLVDFVHLRIQLYSDCNYPCRAVGIAAKRHLALLMTLIERACEFQNTKKNPTKLLGLIRDSKAAASAEVARSNLLRCYGEICKRCDAMQLYIYLEKHIVPWIIKQLIDCKEAGLFALEQVGAAVHPNRLANSEGLKSKGNCLATLLTLLQSHTGYRPLQLYPALLQTMISLLKIPPSLSSEERQTLLSTVLDKIIGASTEINLILSSEGMEKIHENLGFFCSEIIGDSADALAELVDILVPWMQSNDPNERKTTLLVLRTSLKSYYESLKYTYPGGKLEPGKLVGRVLCWSADGEITHRSIVVDSVVLAIKIGARHRSKIPDNNINSLTGVKMLATAACERIASGEIVSLAEGLIEGLLYRGESGIAAAIGLNQLFTIRGAEIPRSDLYIVDNIISQMRQLENSNCRYIAAESIKSLTFHHSEEVMEHLLHQPLPPDRGTEECWKALGSDEECGLKTLEFLLNRLENNNILYEGSTASLPSLAAIIALRHLLQSAKSTTLIEKYLSELLSIQLKYLSGWLHVDAPVSILSTKFGFVPNREACKLNPHREVYTVLTNLLTVVNANVASSLLNVTVFDSNEQASESLISTVCSVIRCVNNRNDVLVKVAQSLGKLVISDMANQRAVAVAFYAELIGKIDCGPIWLDAIVNILHEAKSDSYVLVRKLAIKGITRIAYLESSIVDEYFDNCMAALLDGLEEPSSAGNDVVLESLKGLSIFLALKIERSVNPNVVLAMKPFVEKENWEIKLAAISAIGAISIGWLKSIQNEHNGDVTDHLLGFIPCLVIRLEDTNPLVVKAARQTLCDIAKLLQCDRLTQILKNYLSINEDEEELKIEAFLRDLVECLIKDMPQRAEELRNATVRGYSRSEVCSTRATAILILGFFGQPRPEDVQRMLQLLRDKDGIVKSRAAKALAQCFYY